MALENIKDAEAISSGHTAFVKNKGSGRGFLDTLQTIIDEGFQKAELTYKNVDLTKVAGTLFIEMGPGEQMAKIIGDACAEYWSRVVDFGEPELKENLVDYDVTPEVFGNHGDSVIIKVTNDAAKIAEPITNSILGLAGSKPDGPPYAKFIEVIHDEVKTIEWTIVEEVEVTLPAPEEPEEEVTEEETTEEETTEVTEEEVTEEPVSTTEIVEVIFTSKAI